MNHRDRNCGLNSKLAGENRNRGLNYANWPTESLASATAELHPNKLAWAKQLRMKISDDDVDESDGGGDNDGDECDDYADCDE